MMDKRQEIRAKALADLQHSGVLMLNGHFDYGNGYHGKAYLNPHQLFRQPSTIWRFAQDLLDVVPMDVLQQVELVAGPATGGTLLAHTLAGLLDSRRSLTHASREEEHREYERGDHDCQDEGVPKRDLDKEAVNPLGKIRLRRKRGHRSA